MNPTETPLMRHIFSQAMQLGPSREPVAVAAVFAKHQVDGDRMVLDVGEFEGALDEEFPWRNQFVYQSRPPEPDELEAWIQAIRWLVQSLLAVDGNELRMHVLLTALGILDVGCEGLGAILDHFVGTQVPAGIISILQRAEHIPESLNERTEKWLQELPGQVKDGNFKVLQDVQRVIQLDPQPDIWTAIFLLWKLEPRELAYLLNTRECALLDVVVCIVLDANAPLFALDVESVMFKFISQSWLERMTVAYPEITQLNIQEQLLLQVAQTHYWRGWLEATYEYPNLDSEESRALAEALTKLAEPQWRDFIFALAPSKLGSSAQAVASILTHVIGTLGPVETRPFWSAAFERWSDWDYGKGEEHFFLSSPQVCAFDFPVSMYYASMSSTERDAQEHELQNAIIHVEQQWFTSESELCSERNRLASRLRLVRHGSVLAAGGAYTLPPQVLPDSEYAEVRYRFHDVDAVLQRTLGR